MKQLVLWTSLKLKAFCYVKNTNISVKDKPHPGQIICKLYYFQNVKNSQNSIMKKPNKKWAKDLNRHFAKEDTWKGNEQMKRCSTLGI